MPNTTTEFYLPSGTSYAVQLISFEEKNETLVATIEVSPEVWDTIDMVMLFNLTWENQNPGSVIGTKPLQIEMFYSADLYAEFKKSNLLIMDSKVFLEASKEDPIKSTKNWFITQVTEEVELSDVLKEIGSLREGFTTTWKK